MMTKMGRSAMTKMLPGTCLVGLACDQCTSVDECAVALAVRTDGLTDVAQQGIDKRHRLIAVDLGRAQ